MGTMAINNASGVMNSQLNFWGAVSLDCSCILRFASCIHGLVIRKKAAREKWVNGVLPKAGLLQHIFHRPYH